MNWKETELELINLDFDDIEDSKLIEDKSNKFLFKFSKKSFLGSLRICQNIGGEIATPFENTELKLWREKLNENEPVILGYTNREKESEFRNFYTGYFIMCPKKYFFTKAHPH